jgi:cyclase
MRQVDELIVVDITATRENREPDYEEIGNFTKECFVPITIGGGIKNIDQVKKILRAGADKVCIGSAIFKNPKLISEIAQKFGSQCVVASIDAKRTKGGYECYAESGTKKNKITPEKLAKKAEELGAGEILLTSIDNDGVMKGYDLNLIKKVTKAVSIPVIASGGAGNYQDMFDAISAGASAIAAAAIFHFTEQTPLEAKKFLKEKGIKTRK